MKAFTITGVLAVAALGAFFFVRQSGTATVPRPVAVGHEVAPPADKQAAPADADSSDQWTTLKGQLVWAGGAIPAPEKLNVDKDQDHCLEKGPLFSEKWVIDKETKGVKNVFVWLAPEPDKKLPIHPNLEKIADKDKKVVMDQPCCAFEPHALAIREGQILVVKNSSPKSHNVNWFGSRLKNPGNNLTVPPGKFEEITLKADRLPVSIACNIHGWMNARVAVLDHPYFAVTDAKGNFEIKLAPVGAYRMYNYHDDIGWRLGANGSKGEPVTIKPVPVNDVGKLEIKKSD